MAHRDKMFQAFMLRRQYQLVYCRINSFLVLLWDISAEYRKRYLALNLSNHLPVYVSCTIWPFLSIVVVLPNPSKFYCEYAIVTNQDDGQIKKKKEDPSCYALELSFKYGS